MVDPNREDSEYGGGLRIDLWALVKAHGRAVLLAGGMAAVIAGALGFLYLRFGQETTRIAYLEFRPTFGGFESNRYPNGLPFSLGDVTAASIMDTVFNQSAVEPYCDRMTFRGAFFAEQYSDASLFLDLEYRARLSERGLEWGDRRQLEEEYEARRAALPVQFRLVFVEPSTCSGLPRSAVVKSMESILATWASESESKRGVLNHQIQILTPATLDILLDGPGGWVLGADLLRSALGRLVTNIEQVSSLPGAGLVRLGEERLTFIEVRGKLQDLLVFKLEPLVLTAGRSLANQSLAWINETVESAEREERLAESRVAVYRDALREFSGEGAGPATARSSSGGALGGPSLSPQIDRSFVDRIVEMSLASSPYRQELTDAMVKANLEAVEARNRANYYRRLVQSLRTTNGVRMTAEELNGRLEDIVKEGKALATQFGALYEEFSRVSLRPASEMYETLKPVAMIESRAFNRRELLQLVLVVFVAGAVLTLGVRLARDQMTKSARTSA